MQSAVETIEERTSAFAGPLVKRRLWWVIHSWVGLKLSLFMVWVLFTGTFAVFSVEMDWLARPALRVQPQDAPHVSWGTMTAAAMSALPEGRVTTLYSPPHAWFAAEAIALVGDDDRKRIYINPYDGRVQGVASWMSCQRFFREMHRHLLLPAKYGIPIVSSLSILLLLSIITGLVTYKKFWRGFFRLPQGGSARRLTGDLHRFGGLWSLWFTILITLTGAWYLVESLGGGAPVSRQPKAEASVDSHLDAARIDEFVAIAQRAYPNLQIRELRLPEDGRPLGIFGQADAVLVRDRVNGVWIDPASGEVLGVVKGETLSVHQRISEMADPLHFGTWGGMTTKVVWFLFGLVMTGLSVTGIMIYCVRLKKAYASERPSTDNHWLRRAWDGMGSWGYIGAGIILLSLVMIPGWLAR
ncbi:MAG: PepSY-associated TM helix domain-containing protein [Steroidobacter sp.]